MEAQKRRSGEAQKRRSAEAQRRRSPEAKKRRSARSTEAQKRKGAKAQKRKGAEALEAQKRRSSSPILPQSPGPAPKPRTAKAGAVKQSKQSPLGVLASVCVPPVQLNRAATHINTDLAPPTPMVTEAQKRRNAETVEAQKRKGAEAQKRWKRRSAEAQKR